MYGVFVYIYIYKYMHIYIYVNAGICVLLHTRGGQINKLGYWSLSWMVFLST